MRNLAFIIFVFLLSFSSYSQNKENQTIVAVGDIYEVTIYYDNGNVMQHGFLSKDNKLHGSWESYYDDGSRKCYATYNYGKKVGTWFYWNDKKMTTVRYRDNKIISSEESDSLK